MCFLVQVRAPSSQGPSSPYINQLIGLEEAAKSQEKGLWSKDSVALTSSVRDLPPSSVGQDSAFNATELLEENKGKSMPAVVEQVRDGSTVRVFLLPSFHFVQVYVAGIQVGKTQSKTLSSSCLFLFFHLVASSARQVCLKYLSNSLHHL